MQNGKVHFDKKPFEILGASFPSFGNFRATVDYFSQKLLLFHVRLSLPMSPHIVSNFQITSS